MIRWLCFGRFASSEVVPGCRQFLGTPEAIPIETPSREQEAAAKRGFAFGPQPSSEGVQGTTATRLMAILICPPWLRFQRSDSGLKRRVFDIDDKGVSKGGYGHPACANNGDASKLPAVTSEPPISPIRREDTSRSHCCTGPF